MKKKPVGLAVTLGILAFIFMTILPVSLAVFFAAPNP